MRVKDYIKVFDPANCSSNVSKQDWGRRKLFAWQNVKNSLWMCCDWEAIR